MGLSMISTPFRRALSKSTRDNFPQSCLSQKPIHALLSIKPKYAEAIFRGEKRFEFRRVIFRKPVDVVLVYSTSPVSRVAGEFEVDAVISGTVEELWKRTKHCAGIDRRRFFSYFHGREVGYAIAIGSVRRYATSLDLRREFGIRPPQSFVYLNA